ncbi:DUF6726 family protein [Pandoraea pnomenusa]|uniref:DUF6726 family protein n=1 Tax=Pandoraea pnomenusa TaxID=93220 RepID=UPI00333E6F01
MNLLFPKRRETAAHLRARTVNADEHDPRGSSAKHGDAPASASRPAPRNLRRWWSLFAILPFVTSVSGCGLMAAPCRVASAGLKIVPVVGGVLAAPTDGCAAVID